MSFLNIEFSVQNCNKQFSTFFSYYRYISFFHYRTIRKETLSAFLAEFLVFDLFFLIYYPPWCPWRATWQGRIASRCYSQGETKFWREKNVVPLREHGLNWILRLVDTLNGLTTQKICQTQTVYHPRQYQQLSLIKSKTIVWTFLLTRKVLKVFNYFPICLLSYWFDRVIFIEDHIGTHKISLLIWYYSLYKMQPHCYNLDIYIFVPVNYKSTYGSTILLSTKLASLNISLVL